MKKMLIYCGVLCMTLLLFCGTALAKVEVKPTSGAGSATVTPDEAGQKFTVSQSGVNDGDLYLVMIQQGSDASVLPTSENLYYLNVDKASGTTFTLTAYPKDLTEGDYVVFLSDYSSDTNKGARKAVATLSVTSDEPGGDNGDSNTGGGGDIGTGGEDSQYQCGDVNHSGGKPDNRDIRDLSRYVGEWPDYLADGKIDLSLADVNGSGGKPDNRDVRDLARFVGEWPDYPSLPH